MGIFYYHFTAFSHDRKTVFIDKFSSFCSNMIFGIISVKQPA